MDFLLPDGRRKSLSVPRGVTDLLLPCGATPAWKWTDFNDPTGDPHAPSGFSPFSRLPPSPMISAIDRQCQKITYSNDKGIWWMSLAQRKPNFIASRVDSLNWMPDGNILLERSGEILIFEAGSKTMRRLGDGRAPTLSPDATKVAYIGPDGSCQQMGTDGTRRPWPLSAHKSADAIRWSPVGDLLSFVEPVGDSVPLGSKYNLTVCTTTDFRCAVVMGFNTPAGFSVFRWVKDYERPTADFQVTRAR